MLPFRLITDLIEEKLQRQQIVMFVTALFLFTAAAGLLTIFTSSEMSVHESITLENVEDFVDGPGKSTRKINALLVEKYVFSLPFRVGTLLGLSAQVALMRLWGLIFLLITLGLGYQTSRKIFPESYFIPIATLALLATNNRLIFAAVSLGGGIFFFLLYALVIYFLVEVASRGSLLDIAISLTLVYMLTWIDPFTAERAIMPLLFVAIVVAFLYAYRKQIETHLLDSTLKIAGGSAIILIGFSAAAKAWKAIGTLLQTPASLWPALTGVRSWPEIINHLAWFYAGAPFLPDGFQSLESALIFIFRAAAIVGAVGIAGFIYTGISERFQIHRTADSEPEDAAVQIVFVKPKETILAKINIPALLLVALVPPTVFAAANAYVVAKTLNEGLLFILLLPLVLLLLLGIKHVATMKSSQSVAAITMLGLLTANVGTTLITILWR